ncbi:MAG: helix-turn-helix transcriptional regulator [Alphaproteobacteria bacterium]|nr:helix-turn-helix transcriptional regulator [Alphaproteobacteria bacterium]
MNAIRPLARTAKTVTLARDDYEALIEALDEARDRADVRALDARLAAGETEFLPWQMVKRLAAGESPVRLWRQRRKLSARVLAAKAKIAPTYLSEIETGKKPGSMRALAALARALGVALDDLAPRRR